MIEQIDKWVKTNYSDKEIEKIRNINDYKVSSYHEFNELCISLDSLEKKYQKKVDDLNIIIKYIFEKIELLKWEGEIFKDEIILYKERLKNILEKQLQLEKQLSEVNNKKNGYKKIIERLKENQ
ncbi:hypothetical protein Dtox_2572 [Desulfofarcimen acetoxidans DSM 771]|uniref:Uncharacterized protein n=1 Tax=Desulfofarcimen acetoxidans (strain ATCC 49208 / DSM 771 / KCTC 5769 / VKM B-1644 / 5575) TaxID=485916 RepID=C8W0W0_DESAS|nr:hypothetical protein [Desulfofarcimen acetoxidans]ACV63365.1 hypothetical protein Dtox_2572 [Desulfofarcimen acetoxidans DSM 771]